MVLFNPKALLAQNIIPKRFGIFFKFIPIQTMKNTQSDNITIKSQHR
jgi:hypothetical protein